MAQCVFEEVEENLTVSVYVTILKVRIPPQMSQMNTILRPLIVATTLDPHLIVTILFWKAITLHLHLKERL